MKDILCNFLVRNFWKTFNLLWNILVQFGAFQFNLAYFDTIGHILNFFYESQGFVCSYKSSDKIGIQFLDWEHV